MNRRIKTPRHQRQTTPDMHEHLADLWARAIEHEGIDPTGAIQFSPTNPHAVAYARVMGRN